MLTDHKQQRENGILFDGTQCMWSSHNINDILNISNYRKLPITNTAKKADKMMLKMNTRDCNWYNYMCV